MTWEVIRSNGDRFTYAQGIRTDSEDRTRACGIDVSVPDLGLQMLMATPLRVWGRTQDEYAVDSVIDEPASLLITFGHMADAVQRAGARLDLDSGRLVALVRPTDATRLTLLSP